MLERAARSAAEAALVKCQQYLAALPSAAGARQGGAHNSEVAAAREQAVDAQALLRDVIETVPAAICLLTGTDFEFAYVNAAYERLVPGRSLIGRKVADVFSEVDPSQHLARLRRVLETGEIEYAPEVRTIYDRGLTGSTSEAFFSTVLGPLHRHDGRIVGVVAATSEVTQQVQRLNVLRDEAEAARDALREEKALLATRVAERTEELAQTNRALAAEISDRTRVETQLRELLQRLATAREEEQRRIARDLHDQVGQTLTAFKLAMQAIRSDSTLSSLSHHRLADLQQLSDDLAREVQSLAMRLRPIVLDDLGLNAAVARLLSDFSARYHVATDLLTAGFESVRLPTEVETAIFRIVQESLTNVARHAQANQVTVIIERRPTFVIAIVEDDGIGCDPNEDGVGARLGWVGMRERTLSVGGTLNIESMRGRGTTVIATIPSAENAADGRLP
jgi:PAS domain S-box-containing protein